MPLTDEQVQALQPGSKARRFADGGGMYLEVTPAGGRYWRLKYRIGGREKRISLGVYPTVSLGEAREAAQAARAQLAQGIDPSQHRKARKAVGDRWPPPDLVEEAQRVLVLMLRQSRDDGARVMAARAILGVEEDQS